MVDSVRSPGMTSSVTVPLTTQVDCVRHVCGVSITLVLMECAVWTYKMVMSVSNHLAAIINLFNKGFEILNSSIDKKRHCFSNNTSATWYCSPLKLVEKTMNKNNRQDQYSSW